MTFGAKLENNATDVVKNKKILELKGEKIMRTNEFIEYMKKNVNKATREDQVVSMVKKQLEVKEYLGIKQKRDLIEDIANASILYDNGVFKFDAISKYVYFTMYTIAAYTNLELSDDIEDDFDELSREKLLPIVISVIQDEYDDVNILLQMHCDSILENNSVETIVGKFLEEVLGFLKNVESGLKSGLGQFSNLKLGDNVDLGQIVELMKSFQGLDSNG